jgi:hypothetical protein
MTIPPPHDDTELMAGTDWVIAGTLLDVDGNPLELSNATLQWTLIGPDGLPVLQNGDAAITVTGIGTINIAVHHAVTAMLDPGRYAPLACATRKLSADDVFDRGAISDLAQGVEPLRTKDLARVTGEVPACHRVACGIFRLVRPPRRVSAHKLGFGPGTVRCYDTIVARTVEMHKSNQGLDPRVHAAQPIDVA